MKTKLTMIIFITCLFSAEAQEWTWSEDQLSYARECLSATTLDDSLFFSGGRLYNYNYINTVDIYDVGDDLWSTVGLESQYRCYTTSVSCNGKVFIAGGINLSGNINCADVDIYDKNTGQWTIEYLSQGRHFISAVANGNKVFFAGGIHYDGSFNYHDVIDVYDTDTETWDTPLSLTEAKGGVGVAAVGSKVFFAGGSLSPYTHSNKVEIYDISTGEWTYETLSEARGLPATVAYGDKVYIAGGMIANSMSSDVVEIYNVATGEWEDPQALSFPRIGRALKVMDALVFAGETDYISSSGNYGNANGIIDIYYPETNQWDFSVPDLDPPRITYGCTAYDNKAYFAGGYPGGTSVSGLVSILEYFPDTIPNNYSEGKFQYLEIELYPNPFTSSIRIDLNLPYSENISISIYNSNGELVENKTTITLQPGDQYTIANTDKLKPGIYFCTLKTKDEVQTKKIIKL